MNCIKCPRLERLKKEIADLEANQDLLFSMLQNQYGIREVGGGYLCLEKPRSEKLPDGDSHI